MLRQHHRDLNKADLRAVYAEELSTLAEVMRGIQFVVDTLEGWDAKPLEDPGKCLPFELMGRIFEFAALEMRPSFLTHVCRGWRQIALNTPAMWTTVAGGWGLMADSQELSLSMERSNALPLRIKAVFPPLEASDEEDWDDSQDDLEQGDGSEEVEDTVKSMGPTGPILRTRAKPTLDITIPHAFRWRSLTIETKRTKTMEKWFTAHPAISTPNLEELSFEDTDFLLDCPLYIPWPFQDSLKLHTLNIGSFCSDLGTIGAQLVDLRGGVDDGYCRMLGQCPGLQKLNLNFFRTPWRYTTCDPIELHSLVDMTLSFLGWDALKHFFPHVHMPSVETLALNLQFDHDQDGDPESFDDLPSTLLLKLHQLSIKVDNFTSDKKAEWLEGEVLTCCKGSRQ